MAKKTRPKKPRSESSAVCNRCGAENGKDVKKCAACGSQKFAPNWVLALRPITRQTSVQITKTNPQFGPVEERITLSKWWPGGRSSFHLPDPEQWVKIRSVVDHDLGPELGWKSPQQVATAVKEKLNGGGYAQASDELSLLAAQYPELTAKLVSSFDVKKLGSDDLDRLADTLTALTEAITQGSAGFRDAFISVLEGLPKQEKKALEELEVLLGSWSLHQVTSAAQTVKGRLDTIQLFRRQVADERTFELRGDTSIHRILEAAMWMIDERYWLLKSNKTLRSFIGEEMSRKDKKRYGTKRPDFVCGSIGGKLIIVELKRPSHTLTTDDLNQLETYMTVVEDYSEAYSSVEGYLVGNKKDDDLTRRMKFRSSKFKILTYSDLIDQAEQRYEDYLSA